jgi:predicted nuclease of predicted toxin-antitoxin system
MRILLDENLDWRLERALVGHHVESVQRNGMAGLQNGTLLAVANESFDVFVTMDGNIEFQQNYSALMLRIVALRAKSNRLSDTEPLMPKLVSLLPTLRGGTLTVVAVD